MDNDLTDEKVVYLIVSIVVGIMVALFIGFNPNDLMVSGNGQGVLTSLNTFSSLSMASLTGLYVIFPVNWLIGGSVTIMLYLVFINQQNI